MHVPLRRCQVLVSRQLLNRSRRCPSHGEMRTEGMPQAMDPGRRELRPAYRPSNMVLHHLLRYCGPVALAQHTSPAQMPLLTKCSRESLAQWYVPQPSSFGGRHLALPIRTFHTQLPFVEIDVPPFERHHLAAAESSFPIQVSYGRNTNACRRGPSPNSSRVNDVPSRMLAELRICTQCLTQPGV